MIVVYIAGPYRSGTVNGIYENIQKARAAAVEYWRANYVVICPHLNSAFMDGAIFSGACDDSIWLNGGLELLKRSDIIVMLPGWKNSEGSRKEHDAALKMNKTIEYYEE